MADLREEVLPLDQAASRWLPGWPSRVLYTEYRKGRLQVWRIAGKLGTTESAVREMCAKCLVDQSLPASTSETGRAGANTGSSSTGAASTAQIAAKAIAKALRKRSLDTLQPPTRRRKPKGELIELSSRT